MRWVAAVAAAQMLLGRRLGTRETQGIVGLMTAAALAPRPRAPVLAAGAVGMLAEHVGTRTGRPFGRYSYSGRLGPRVAGVPVLAGAAWAMMARPAWSAVGPGPWRAARAAAALTAWDVFLDPRMVREGYWTWADGGAYEDVPASNFAGWFLTGLVIFAFFDDEDDDPAARAMYVWTWVGETVANAFIWRQPRVALAGGLAMGAFAAPALR
jgi:putative membrane protein